MYVTGVLLAAMILVLGGTAAATYAGKNGRVAFVSNLSGTYQLYTMNSDGSDRQQITNLPPTDFTIWNPDYSPDGRRIVFYSQQNTPRLSSIYKVRPDGSQLRYLEGPNGLYPTYSPDGKQILFSGGPTVIDSVNLYTMNADGSNVQTIATDLIVGGCGGVIVLRQIGAQAPNDPLAGAD
jgi:TolB protein